LTTIADVIAEVNTRLGASTLTFAGGVMTYQAPSGSTGVTMYQDATSPSARGGRGFSHFFGLNDLMQAEQPGNYDTGLAAGSSHGFGSSGIAELEFRGPQGQKVATLSLDFSVVGGTVNDILTALNANSAFGNHGSFSLDANGALKMTPKNGFEAYKIEFVSDTSARGDTKQGFTSFFGIGDKFIADAAKRMKVKDAIYADPKKLAIAKVDTSAAAIAGSVPALTAGDGRGAVEFQKLAEKSVTFGAAGHLAGVTTTLGAYAGAILSDMATQASITNNLKEDRIALSGDLLARLNGKTGVNLDEELANMVIYQNAYNASARLINTAREMFDTLLSIAG
jgi:flagellar hook-associated protein 1 FlgK